MKDPAETPKPSKETGRARSASTSSGTATIRKTRVFRLVAWTVGLLAVVGIVTAAMLSAQPKVSAASGLAPAFTLPNTSGETVSLADFAGKPVILYFSEGAGCSSCIVQMKALEADPQFAKEGLTILPIVMDPPDFIRSAMASVGISTPFLIDDGKVSKAYGVLGTGMHADLPGHGFVLINAAGDKVWQGNYPSMWLAPADLLAEVNKHL